MLGEAEISKLRLIRLVQEDVVVLDVQVHKVPEMHEIYPLEDATEPEPGQIQVNLMLVCMNSLH
jgi:hypothetical protein